MRLQEGGSGGGVEISESPHWENKRDGKLSRQQSKGRAGERKMQL